MYIQKCGHILFSVNTRSYSKYNHDVWKEELKIRLCLLTFA